MTLAVNVAKDVTAAGEELRRSFRYLSDDYAWHPGYVIEPLALGSGRFAHWQGPREAAVLVAEWLQEHDELHVYPEDSLRVAAWTEQRETTEPLGEEDCAAIWRRMATIRAVYARPGVVPSYDVNAGDFVGRREDDGEWSVVVVWPRRSPASQRDGAWATLEAMLVGDGELDDPRRRKRPVRLWKRPEAVVEAVSRGILEREAHRRVVSGGDDSAEPAEQVCERELRAAREALLAGGGPGGIEHSYRREELADAVERHLAPR